MGISYADSVKKISANNRPAQMRAMTYAVPERSMIATADDVSEHAGYQNYGYEDTVYSTIDNQKNIILSANQIIITQESNSQYIPFRMPRYYDGFDLSSPSPEDSSVHGIWIVYENSKGQLRKQRPINVYFTDSNITFGWLLGKYVTAVSGQIRFEINVVGRAPNNEEYVWKSRISSGLTVIESLSGDLDLPDETDPDTPSEIAARVDALEDRVEELEYEPIAISYFSNNAGTKEYGDVVSTVTLSWGINGTPTELTLDGSSINVSLRSLPLENQNITSYKEWRLAARDERTSVQKSTSISFRNRVWYGEADLPDVIDSDFIKSLNHSELTTTRVRNVSYNATGTKYAWYCTPVSFGECVFKMGSSYGGLGLVGSFEYKNGGYTTMYNVYRNGQEGVGQFGIEVT